MCPEAWQAVRSVALLYWGDAESVAPLFPTVHALTQALPDALLTLLIPHSVQLIDCPIDSVTVISLQHVRATDQVRDELTAVDCDNQENTDLNCISALISILRQQKFDAAIVFTDPGQSPYALAYLCYLAGIAIRLGQSQEFGGGVLSTRITPPLTTVSLVEYHRHLLDQAGLLLTDDVELAIAP
jgi:ABC-type transporter Mla MlaB component